ncbi:toprim domain-containing protein [Bacteroides sp. ET71]|uniref:toprim domain-containing protein n=1 Tax=Bacteroides sp. ET71 TaxID=2939421 RepID=UPI0020130874|nr:toprim domain-containing protein [Bacteroides sp. ET71]MCL1616889.1 toprim domain-containing protein [Bacteroides sp. ET71]
MDIQTAKQIRLEEYLHSLGYSPVKRQGINLWYKSPFREETEASFKVNTERNQWYDFALGKGGNIIALASHLYATDSVPYLLKRIEEQTPHVHPVSFSFGKQDSFGPSFQQLEIVPLSSPALLFYLQGRGIDLELAKRECSEARYTHNGKRYFAIAFPNGSGGFEVRNSYFKGCIAPKEISHIRQAGKARNTCYVFEGFMDYLSFLTLRQESCPNYPELDGQDYIVLNSVSNVNKALYPLGNYERIHCFFDNDRAGMEALRQIRKEYDSTRHIRDASQIYCGCKDLNEYLQKRMADGKEQMQSVRKRNGALSKKPKGFRL